ncbi:hypothetical protein TIFTF001_014843 [Ficus carica]|uniref:pectinesterase n=1 Tax=Ficus carica TaxID=3494 RepID=A0AA88D7B4_FICCA|nr:hypothetical protein TIFTF001_014843 [Ficus carica]
MDSINIFKGYGKVNPNHLQDQNPEASHKRRRLIAISALLFLSLVLGVTIGALIHESATESPEPSPSSLASNSAESTIRSVCNVTRFPDACISSLTAVNNPPESDPVSILKLSLRVAIAETSRLSSSLRSVNSGDADAATRDCQDLVEEALSRLNDSAVAIGKGGDLTAEKRGDLQTWIGAAETDQETCVDGLEETKSAVFDKVKAEIDNSMEFTSNALAIVANFESILDKLNLVRH